MRFFSVFTTPGPLSLIWRFQIQSHLLSMEQLLFSRVHSLGRTHASKGRKYGFTKVQSASDLITVKYHIASCKIWRNYWSLYLNGLLSCSSGALWHAYLRRCLSERMTMRKRFYASMRLSTFTKVVLPNAIFNLQLYVEKTPYKISWTIRDVKNVLFWSVSDSVNVELSTAWISFFPLIRLINFC